MTELQEIEKQADDAIGQFAGAVFRLAQISGHEEAADYLDAAVSTLTAMHLDFMRIAAREAKEASDG